MLFRSVDGIPALLWYKKGNNTYIPDDIVTGADPSALDSFFKRCGNNLLESNKVNPIPTQIKK